MKVKFGSAWPGENKENEIVAIPGLRGREPKEISLKNLSKVIHARVVEIIEQVFIEIKNYGFQEQKKKLIAGIVLTGGGSQLKHLKQLVEYITGMDTRIGQPNEHLAGDSDREVTSPMYATGVGLLMKAIESDKKKAKNYVAPEPEVEAPIIEEKQEEVLTEPASEEAAVEEKEISKTRKSIFERWSEKFTNFLENQD